jgi:hypothetical protein
MGWFGRKRVGWGLRPVTWQGWLVTIVYIAIILALGLTLSAHRTILFVTCVAIATALFILVAFLTRD